MLSHQAGRRLVLRELAQGANAWVGKGDWGRKEMNGGGVHRSRCLPQHPQLDLVGLRQGIAGIQTC